MSSASEDELERQMREALGVDRWKPGQLTDDQRPVAEKLLGERGLNRLENRKRGQRYRPPVVQYEFFYVAHSESHWRTIRIGGWTFQKVEDGVQAPIKTGLSEDAARQMARDYEARGFEVKEHTTEAQKYEREKEALKPRSTKNPSVSRRRQMLDLYGNFKL